FESQHHGTALQVAGAAMEGKEVRFGIPASSLFAASTTLTSTGAVNAAHDSLSPLGGGIALFTGVPERTISRILRRHGVPRLPECDPMTGELIRASRSTALRYERERP